MLGVRVCVFVGVLVLVGLLVTVGVKVEVFVGVRVGVGVGVVIITYPFMIRILTRNRLHQCRTRYHLLLQNL